MEGKLIIVSAPSGAGKTTIVKHLLDSGLGLEFSVSACSRPPRMNEADGKDYYFLGLEGFRRKITENAFIEWEEVYPGQYYGTFRSELQRIWDKGNHVLFDVDVKGGLNLKRIFGEQALSLFIMPPSMVELEKRLRNRSTDPEESIVKRISKATQEMMFAGLFDRVIVNDKLEEALQTAMKAVEGFVNQPLE
jgi:guanylate kinase